ncbi:MAG: TM0106 family RecB-like putative nuclease [Synechococcales bacterium]|nr:TM0106 family RecB-like putative nuclease [Synechococcales bacterium]
MLLTADYLLNYQRCSRRAFLDRYGNPALKDPTNDYVLKLMQDSLANHQLVLADLEYERPRYPAGDWQAGFAATQALMAAGVECIYQGILIAEIDGVTLVSNPDLLVRQPGVSRFGHWLYAPVEIKLSKRSKTEYQIVTAYHVKVLALVQDAWTETAYLLLREKGEYAIDLWEMIPRMENILADCIQTLKADRSPDVFISRNRCSLCHWYSHCYAIAKETEHLSLLPGITQSRFNELQALNLTTLASLSTVIPRDLENLPGFGLETAKRVIRQAKASLNNQALPADGYPTHSQRDRFLREMIPTAAVELYFDIESEPSLELIYLHGVLVVDRIKQATSFHSFLAQCPEEEAQVWQQFLELVWAYPTAPIFHFCPYEVQTVNKLAKQYDTPIDQIQPLLPRFVDLHDIVTLVATLPVESYALKNIARWLGFEWRDANANGAQSIYWYAQWLQTGDRTFLDAIQTYNEDDCRATHLIKDWLVDFLQAGRFLAQSA